MMRSNIKESVLLEIAKDLGASLIDYRHVDISQFFGTMNMNYWKIISHYIM